MTEHNIFRKMFSHTLEELEIPNLAISFQISDFEKVRKAHDSIHEFIYLAPHLVNSDEEFHGKSAFLLYHNEAFWQAHRSFLDALAGYYNAAYTLLRNTLELLIKGAFWECIAHKRYRNKAEVVKKTGAKIGESKVTLIDWLNDIINQSPSIEDELEKTSAGIFDKISPLFENEALTKIIPKLKPILQQLADWKIFDPIQESISPVDYVYELYHNLSADVHVTPDKTNIGKRLLAEKELFENEILPTELNTYAETLHKVIDIGIVVELNILGDLIEDFEKPPKKGENTTKVYIERGVTGTKSKSSIIKTEKSKKWLSERLFNITSDLELNYASTKIAEVIK